LNKLTVRRESPGVVTLAIFTRGNVGAGSSTDVTFGDPAVTFAGGRGAVPGCGEVGMAGPGAEAVGALAAHPGGLRGAGHAAGYEQRTNERRLPGDCPAIAADARD
jgi:hypothetical protein